MPQRAHSVFRTVICNLIFVLLFASALFWSLVTAYGYRIDPINRQVVQSGVLNLQNVTKGVEIYLDNSLENSKTPCTLNNLAIQSYHLVLEHDGYRTWEKDVEIQRNVVTDIGQIKLVPEVIDDSIITYTQADIFDVNSDGRLAVYNQLDSYITLYDSHGKKISQTQSPRNDIANLFWKNGKLYVEQEAGRTWELRSDNVWQHSSLESTPTLLTNISPDYSQGLDVQENEIWITDIQNGESDLFSRFSSDVDWVDWYSATQIIYAVDGEVRVCDLDQVNCYSLTSYDPKNTLLLENNTLYFSSNGILSSITLLNNSDNFLGIF